MCNDKLRYAVLKRSPLYSLMSIYLAVYAVQASGEDNTASGYDELRRSLDVCIAIELEIGSWPVNVTPPLGNHHVRIVPGPGGDDTNTLHVTFPEGEHTGASLLIPLKNDNGQEPVKALLRYEVWFDESWNTSSSGKLPGFSGTYFRGGWGGRPNDGYNGWSARGMFSPTTAEGHTLIGVYVYHTETLVENPGYVYGEGMSFHSGGLPPLEHNRWHTIEIYIQLNTLDDQAVNENAEITDAGNAATDTQAAPGRFDGVIRGWINGISAFERSNLRFRHTDSLRIQSAWLDFYHGGKVPAPKEMQVYIRNIEVHTSYD